MTMHPIGHFFLSFVILSFTECSNGQAHRREEPPMAEVTIADSTVLERFPPPSGFIVSTHFKLTFEDHLQRLPLKPVGSQVHLFDGSLKYDQDMHAAVIDVSVGDRDLQQCADAIMRLRAEFLLAAGRYHDIHFNFTNGFRADFSRWANGERIQVLGDKCLWKGEGRTGLTRDNLMSFMNTVFTYAGTASLSQELRPCAETPVAIGDVFIQGGHPGHAMIVVNVANNPITGEQLFLLAQSFMPAQEIHVVKNPEDPAISPWYRLNEGQDVQTPGWRFRWEDRRRW